MNMVALEIRDSSATHVGLVRPSNQDAYCRKLSAGTWAVVDGMGGHHDGERATAVIVEAIENLPDNATFAHRVAATRAAIAQANQIIFNESGLTGRRMGAAIAALVIGEGNYAVLWAGDSRAYLKRGDMFHRLTRDHTQAQELVAAGLLEVDAVAKHPLSNVLVRAVGVLSSLELDQVDGKIAGNDIFLLCSDGLYNLVSEAEMSEIIDSRGFDSVSEQLVGLGLERRAPDNITVCLVSIANSSPASHIQFGSFHQ
jgi:serine/threonine protein phosphatase Stp1